MRLFGLDFAFRDGGGETRQLPEVSFEQLSLGSFGLQDQSKSAVDTLPVVFGCVSKAINRIIGISWRVLDEETSQSVPSPDWLKAVPWTDTVSLMVTSLWLWGNAYVVPMRTDGRIRSIQILPPSAVGLEVVDGEVRYNVAGKPFRGELLHQRYVTLPDRYEGLSCVQAARKAVELGVASQDFAAQFFRNGTMMSTLFSVKDELSPEQAKMLLAQIRANHTGKEAAFRPIVTGGGMTANNLSMSMSEADFTDVAKWSAQQIASMVFGIDPSLLGINPPGSTLTYTNSVSRERQLWLDALNPLMMRIEELFTHLLPPGQRFDFLEQDLLLGSLGDRSEVIERIARASASIGRMVMTVNELRGLVGLEPVEEVEPVETSMPVTSSTSAPIGGGE